jgi:hydrogenase nickel incorporation protein HypA/HybF
MHELSIAQNILDIIGDHVSSEQRRQIRSIRLKVGEQAGVVPESLEFCFNILIDGTSLQGAVLEMERVPFMVKCNSCGKTSTNESGILFCSSCNVNDVVMISGNELQITEMEISDEEKIEA